MVILYPSGVRHGNGTISLKTNESEFRIGMGNSIIPLYSSYEYENVDLLVSSVGSRFRKISGYLFLIL